MANSIELQVRLGLQSAQAQVNNFKQVLQDMVKVDSTSYKGLERVLTKIGDQANGLKDKLDGAFKTSTSARNFLKQYEELIRNLKNLPEQFESLGISDFILSEEDDKQLSKWQERISQLKTEIGKLKRGKIGNIFDTDDIKNADKVRDYLKEIKADTNNLTFTGLSQSLSRAMTKVERDLDRASEQVTQFQGQLDVLNNQQSIIDKINEVANNNIAEQSFDRSKLIDYQEKLKEFYEKESQYQGATTPDNIKAGGALSTFLDNETTRITKATQVMEDKYHEYEELIGKFKALKGAKGKDGKNLTGKEKIDAANELAASYGLDLQNLEKGEKYTTFINKYIDDIKTRMPLTPADIADMRARMLENLQNLFEGVDFKPIFNPAGIKASLKNIFQEAGFDLRDSDLINIFNNISKDMNIDSFLDIVKTSLTNYSSTVTEQMNQTSESIKEQEQNLNNLKDAAKATNDAGGVNTQAMKNAQDDIEKLTALIRGLLQAYLDLAKQKMPNPGATPELKTAQQAITDMINGLTKLEQKQSTLSNIKTAVTRWMGFWQVLNLTKKAVNDMKSHIKELDTVMTKIAVVTNMTTDDLWKQIGTYSEMARQYGVAIKGVYEVSQIYYQQGLNKGDVMTLTSETLKMARIAGLDYATAADYMTTAIRGFKLEMSDASHVTDVFSNLAAHTASSTEELATAISKTAASAASVGASFEATSAMMATMIATTRESATNIGTALKSIISRYGEMKESISGTDAEGEEFSLNKVDKALQSIGISIHDAAGQFRDFDDVVLELAQAWDGIDKNTQRYIATVMAGNRQQSRFLALVSNVDEYKRALELANNAEDTGTLQTLKTLDSIDAKIERMKVTIQEFYTSAGVEQLYKSILDTITNVISAANSLPKLFDKIPAQAIAIGMSLITIIKNIIFQAIAAVKSGLDSLKDGTNSTFNQLTVFLAQRGKKDGETYGKNVKAAAEQSMKGLTSSLSSKLIKSGLTMLGSLASILGSSLVIRGFDDYGKSSSTDADTAAGKKTRNGALLNILGSTLTGAGMGAVAGGGAFSWATAAVGGAIGLISGIAQNAATIASSTQMIKGSLDRNVELAEKAAQESSQKATQKKGEYKELESAYEKLNQLKEASHESAEALAEYHEYMNQLGESYPSLIDSMQANGDAIINLESLEKALAAARIASSEATLQATKDELKAAQEKLNAYNTFLKDTAKDSYYYAKFSTMEEARDYLVQNYGQYINPNNSSRAAKTVTADDILQLIAEIRYNNDLQHQVGGTTDASKRILNQLQGFGLPTFLEGASIEDLEKQKQDWLNNLAGLLNLTAVTDRNDFSKNNLKDAVEKIQKIDSSLSFEFLTGFESLDKINDKDITLALHNLYSRLSDLVKITTNDIEGITDVVTSVSSELEIHKLIDTNYQDQSKDILNYVSLLSFLFNGRYGNLGIKDWSSIQPEKILGEKSPAEVLQENVSQLIDIILSAPEAAQELMTLDTNQFKNSSELMRYLKDTLKIDNGYFQGYIDQFINNRKNITSEINQLLAEDTFKNFDQTQIKSLYDGFLENGELNTAVLSSLQSNLVQVKRLQNEGYTIAAQNYWDNIEQIFTILGSKEITSKQQQQIADILPSDFTDKDQLIKTANQLKELGFSDLAEAFTNASQTLITNINTQASLLLTKAMDIVKEVEKVGENIGKGMKYSEAAEVADKIFSELPDTDLSLDDIIDFDESLGEYVITTAGLQAQLQILKKNYQEEKTQLDHSIQQREKFNSIIGTAITDVGIDETSEHIIANSSIKRLLFKAGITDTEEIKAYTAEAQDLINDYQQHADEYKGGWAEYLQKNKDNLKHFNEQEGALLDSLYDNSILSLIATYDFSSIAGGTAQKDAKNNLQLLLTEAGASLENFETVWTQLLEGDFTGLNDLLKDTGVQIGRNIQEEALQSNIEQYKQAIEDWQQFGNDQSKWSEQAQKLFAQEHYEDDVRGNKVQVRDFSTDIDTAIDQAYTYLKDQIDGVKYTAEQYNQDILKLQQSKGLGKNAAAIDLFSGGFGIDEFTNYLNTFIDAGAAIDDYFNFDTNTFKENIDGIDFNKLVSYDELTNNFKLNTQTSMTDWVSLLTKAYGVTTERATAIYKELFENEIQQQINDLDTADVGKQAAATLSNIAQGKIGQRIDVSALPDNIKNTLVNNGEKIYEVLSEYQRDQWILGLDATEIDDDEWKAAVIEAQRSIKAKRSKGAGLEGIISQAVSRDEAINYLVSMGWEDANNWTDDILAKRMSFHGYTWDEYTQQFYATEDALATINKRIADAIDKGTTPASVINEWKRQAAQLEAELKQDPQKEALINLLDSYTNISKDVLKEFKIQFSDIDIEQYTTTDAVGKTILTDVEGLKEALGEDYNEIFALYVSTITDEYITNAEKAVSLVSQGTTSQTEIEAFKQAYSQLMNGEEIAFYYDSILKAWTFDASSLRDFLEAQADKLGLADTVKDQWIEDQLAAFTVESLDFNQIFSGTASDKEKSQIMKSLTDYYKTHAKDYNVSTDIQGWAIEQAEQSFNALSAGGQRAVDELLSLKENATTEEIEAAFRAQVNPIKAVYDALSELQIGSVVDKNQIDILKQAGFEVNAAGVVIAVGNLVEAYKSIYTQMAVTGEATIAELNQVMGTYLDNRDGEQQAIDALTKAGGMTYTEFADMFTNIGSILTEDVVSALEGQGIIEALGGNKMRITNFSAFAGLMGWNPDSEEYQAAFKAYNDNLIQYSSHITDEIRGEFEALGQGKIGQKINVSRIVSEYGEDYISDIATTYGAIFENGILQFTKETDITGLIQAIGAKAKQQGSMASIEAEAIIDQATQQNAINLSTAYIDMVSNYKTLSIDIIKNLALATGKSYETIKSQLSLQSNGDGTYRADLTSITTMIELAKDTISDTTYQQLITMLGDIQNNILNSITSTTEQVSKGTTDISAMTAFAQELSQLTGTTYSVSDLFDYDTYLKTFTLRNAAMQRYIAVQKNELEKLGMSGEAIDAYIQDQTANILQQNINIEDFINANDSVTKSKAATQLRQQIRDWNSTQAEKLTNAQIDSYIEQLDAGGEIAVEALKRIKGENVTAEELESVYNASIGRIRQAAEELTKGVGETVTGPIIGIMDAANFDLQELGQGKAVITSIGNMVEAYQRLYALMSSNSQATTAEINSLYASLLTEMDKSRIDTLETLENAAGMTYDTFGELLATYEIKLEDVISNYTEWGVATDGFGNIQITNWQTFVDKMNAEGKGAQWDPNNPKLLESYSAYIDAMAELANQPMTMMQKASDELNGVLEAKPGQAVNVSYLSKLMGEGLNNVITKYGAELNQGLLLLGESTDIPALVTAIANEAAKAGAIIPSELAKIADAIADMLSEIASLLSDGIGGSLNNEGAQKLSTWAAEYFPEMNLQFNQTKEGLQLATNQAVVLVNKMRDLDAIQGEVAFNALKENLIETDDRFKSVGTQAAEIAKVESNLIRTQRGLEIIKNNNQVAEFNALNGNVDMYNRPKIDMGNGDYATVLTSTLESRNYNSNIPWVMNITPIPPDASSVEDILSDSEIDEYIQGILDQNPINGEAILELDKIENGGKGLIIDLKQVAEVTEAEVNAMATSAEILHQMSEVYEAINSGEEFDSTKIDQYKQELALLKEIQLARATSEDSSFNFMDNAIPAAQNNPLNYYENWGRAWQAITTAGQEGYMAYQDFYNIVTEMNNIAGLSGQQIELAGITLDGKMESAAALIEKGAEALSVTADGSIKVDLGSIGIDFAAGADDLAANVNAGIKEMAQSQVQMLDGLIQLLETIVAMEGLGDIDTEGNGIDLGNIFDITWDESNQNIIGVEFKEKYDTWRKTVIDQITEYNKDGSKNADFNKDLANAMDSIKIDGKSLATLIQWEASDWKTAGKDFMQGYSDTLAALYKAALSDNYDLDNIADSVKEVLAASGVNHLTVDIGDTTLVLTSNGVTQIDWSTDNSKQIIESVKEKLNTTDDTVAKNEINRVITQWKEGEYLDSYEIEWALQMNSRIKIVDGTKQITWNGQTFNEKDSAQYQAAINAWRAKDAGIDITQEAFDNAVIKGGTIETTTTIGNNHNIKVVIGEGKVQYYSEVTGESYPNEQALLKDEYKNWQERNSLDKSDASQNYTSFEEWLYGTYNIRVKTLTKVTRDDKNVDITNDPTTRQALNNFIQQDDAAIQKYLTGKENKEGNYEVELEKGVKVTLSGDAIVDSDGIDPAKVRAEIAKALGLDTVLQENISAAIVSGLQSFMESLSSLDAGPAEEVASALERILAAATSLAGIDF